MKRSTDPKRFLSDDESARVSAAIAEAEKRTSAEVKLLAVRHCWVGLHHRARRLFYMHGLDRTAQQNAVMIMLVTTNRELLIYGDRGINEKVADGFWDSIRDRMVASFKANRVGEGLCEAIGEIGDALAEHFPGQTHDLNEISDEVAYGE